MIDKDRIFLNPCVSEARKIFPSLYGYLRDLDSSDNMKNIIGMADIVIDLFTYINKKTSFLYWYDDAFSDYVMKEIFKILKSENFKNGNISLEYIYHIIDRIGVISGDCNIRKSIPDDESSKLFFDIICSPNLKFSQSNLDDMCSYLGNKEKLFICIGKIFIDIASKDDAKLNTEIYNYIESHISNNFNFKEYLGLFYAPFVLCKYYIDKKVDKGRIDYIVNLIDDFCEEGKDREIIELGSYDGFTDILESDNFLKGIIPNQYLDKFFKCDYYVQNKTMIFLLTSECYKDGFITGEHINLISNNEYIIITCMIFSILSGAVNCGDVDKFDWVLGILNLKEKYLLCKELFCYISDNEDIDKITDVVLRYLELNLFFPKIDIIPFVRKRVLNGN